MRSPKLAFAVAALLSGALASEAALAGGRHHHHGSRLSIGLNFGAPLYWHPWPAYHYFPPPVYYYPAPVAVPSSPPVYVERQDAVAEADGTGYWHYCAATRGYYPYVKECPGGWEKVPPVPK